MANDNFFDADEESEVKKNLKKGIDWISDHKWQIAGAGLTVLTISGIRRKQKVKVNKQIEEAMKVGELVGYMEGTTDAYNTVFQKAAEKSAEEIAEKVTKEV